MSLILSEDDLAVGQHICVYSLKHCNESAPILGQSLLVKAICLPYFVGQVLSDPAKPVITLDVRWLNMMKVSSDFVKAQEDGALPPQKRKKPPEQFSAVPT